MLLNQKANPWPVMTVVTFSHLKTRPQDNELLQVADTSVSSGLMKRSTDMSKI